MTCDDLRLGGTLSSAGLSGGTSINSTALMVADWSSILGVGGITAQIQVVNGRAGGFISGDQLGKPRYPTLNMRITGYVAGSTGIQSDTQRQTNTDTFLGLISDPAGVYLEVDMPDGTTRFLYVYDLDAGLMRQPRRDRTIAVPLVTNYPYWKAGGAESSATVNGGPTNVAFGGNREVHDAVLVFSGDGTFTHNGLGWAIEVTGSAAPVTVDLGARTVVESGAPALNRIRRTPVTGKGAQWGWFTPNANNSITTDVSVDITWRDSWA